jgi:23S rRNA (uracil1939-C5)-methyltransferase
MSAESGLMLTLDVEKAAAGGRMIARHEGRVVLVAGAIPGERVVARVERDAKGVRYAEVVDVLSASPDRRRAVVDARCGGNAYAYIGYARQLDLKSEILCDAFARLAKLPLRDRPEVKASPETGYRMRARLHVQGDRLGFYREASHDLCDAASSGQLSAAAAAWITEAEGILQRQRLAGLAAIDLAENIQGDQRACHLELSGHVDAARFAPLAAGLDGLTAHCLPHHAAIDLGGAPAISDVLHAKADDPRSALRLRRTARAFFQGNRFLLEPLVRHVLALVPDGPVVDLYAGVGLFGLSLAASGIGPVTLVEGDPISSADLMGNAEPFRDRVKVERRSVESYLSRVASGFSRTSTIVVDPPRTGLSTVATAALARAKPARLIYVSCDVATLARDVRALTSAGYEMRGLSGFDMFPNTAHIESVACLDRT